MKNKTRLSPKQHKILSHLYQLRVLSYQEIKEFVVKDAADGYLTQMMFHLVNDNYIKKYGRYVDREPVSSFQITRKGVSYLNENGLLEIAGNTLHISPLLPAKDINIAQDKAKHQMSLNHFVLRWAEKEDFEYFDEKHISSFITGARPDGVIVKGDYLFLEMDMGTEGASALEEKWQHYRNFLTSKSYYDIQKNIMVLFILGGKEKNDPSKRRSMLRKQIMRAFPDILSDKFNFVIGTEDELFEIMEGDRKNDIIQCFGEKGFRLGNGIRDRGALNGFNFDLYALKQFSEKENEEFIIDDLTDGNIYSLCKIAAINSIESTFKYKYDRFIKVIEVVRSEEEAYRICSDLDMFHEKIYFTTLSRLRSYPLNTALFQMDKSGNRWHFLEDNLRINIEE